MIIRLIETVSIPETSATLHETTRCNTPEGCYPFSPRDEILNSHSDDDDDDDDDTVQFN
jgi:hypothetical protein